MYEKNDGKKHERKEEKKERRRELYRVRHVSIDHVLV